MLASAALWVLAAVCGAETRTTPVQAAGGGAADDEYARKSDLGFQWGGDARIRYEIQHQRGQAGPVDTRHRLRLRLRIGAGGQFADGKAFWGFRLATGAANPISNNVDLAEGTVFGGGGGFGIDTAFFGFRPHDDVSITIGKMINPFAGNTGQMLFDSDLCPEGLAVGWDIFHGNADEVLRNVHNDFAFYIVDRPNFGATGSFPYLVGNQISANLGPTRTSVGLFFFGDLQSASNTLAPGANINTAGTGYVENEFAIVHGRVSYPFEVDEFPLTVGGAIQYNTTTSSRKQALGYEVRVDAPKLGPGSARLLYRDLGQYSFFAPWNDSELGLNQGMHSGIEIGYQWPIVKPVRAGVTYMRWDSFEPQGRGMAGVNNTVDRKSVV